MMTLKFKTNINCSSCVATVTPYLKKVNNVINWKVLTDDKNKILEVEANGNIKDQVIQVVTDAGFKIEPHGEGLFNKLFH